MPAARAAAGRDPIAYALGFLNCNDISARCMLSIFQFFATKTDASVLRMLNGSPAERLLAPITDYITAKCAVLLATK
jgi:zeta-carotene desaturase